MPARTRGTKGFKHGGTLLGPQIRKVSEARGFAVSRVLTHWAEIVGDDIAAIAKPVEVNYGRQGLGATLTVLTTGAQAPMLEMRKEEMRTRVNAAYGYNAVARIRLTQTAATGFAEGQVAFGAKPKPAEPRRPDPETQAEAAALSSDVKDPDLRKALENLGGHVLLKQNS